MWIILWIISALLSSISWPYRKKAVDNSTLSTSLFSILWPIFWIFVVIFLYFVFGVNNSIFTDYAVIWVIFIIIFLETIANYFEIYVVKNIKLSWLLPFQNFNKLIVVFIWFFIYYWTENGSSITSFLITLFTIFFIVYFSIDIKNIKIDKIIWLFLLTRFLQWLAWLLVAYIFVKYTTSDFMLFYVFFWVCIYLFISIILKDNIKTFFKQTKTFYIARWLSLLLLWLSFVIGIFVIESDGIVVATLISFLTLWFSIISMKFILKDNPTKKQIILAIFVTIFIWIWYFLR